MVHIPLSVSEKILRYLSDNADKKSCRLVCYNWLYLIDKYIGLGIKLTRRNKAKVYDSDLLRSCTSLKIDENAGLLNWYILPVSRRYLTKVEIVGNIQADNWNLILTSCEALEFLTVTLRTSRFKFHDAKIKHFFFPSEFVDSKINHDRLRRVVFKGIHRDLDISALDITSVSNMLNTFGEMPELRQVLFVFQYLIHPDGGGTLQDQTPSIESQIVLHRSVISLMERNFGGISGFGILQQSSAFVNMNIWDKALKENNSCYVFQTGSVVNWIMMNAHIYIRTVVNHRTETLDTFYYRIRDANVSSGLVPFTLLQGFTGLRKLYLSVNKMDFKCSVLQNLSNLIELTLYRCNQLGVLCTPMSIELASLAQFNSKLEYLYISLLLHEEDMNAIFSLPRLIELHIKHQTPNTKLVRKHFDLVSSHTSLKLIFWDSFLQENWNKWNNEIPSANWQCMKQRFRQPLVHKPDIAYICQKKMYVTLQDEGYVYTEDWEKISDHTFLVLNKGRMNEIDWTRIRADYELQTLISQ